MSKATFNTTTTEAREPDKAQSTEGVQEGALETLGGAETPAPDQDNPEADDDAQVTGNEADRRTEAARYRRQLREVERERDGLQERLETLQRAEVNRLAAETYRNTKTGPWGSTTTYGGGIKPEALWASGVQLSALLDAKGDIDVTKVRSAVSAAAAMFGIREGIGGPKSPSISKTPKESGGSPWNKAFSWD
jgi:hypothetical protein